MKREKCLICKSDNIYGFIEITEGKPHPVRMPFCKKHYEMVMEKLQELESKDEYRWAYAPIDILYKVIEELGI